MAASMKENGFKVRCMAKESILGRQGSPMKGNTKWT